jgi:hemerythrin
MNPENVENINKLQAFHRWQLQTSFHLNDLYQINFISDDYLIKTYQDLLLEKILRFNTVTVDLNLNPTDLTSLAIIKFLVEDFNLYIKKLFTYEEILFLKHDFQNDIQHEKAHEDLIRQSDLILKEFNHGKIMTAIGIQKDLSASLCKHFTFTNQPAFSIARFANSIGDAQTWDDLKAFYNLPLYGTKNINLKVIVEKLILDIAEIENGKKETLNSNWIEILSSLTKLNSIAKKEIMNWNLTNEQIINSIEVHINNCNSVCLEKNNVLFMKSKISLLINLYHTLKQWHIDPINLTHWTAQFIQDATAVEELSQIIPDLNSPNLNHQSTEILQTLFDLKNSIDTVNSQVSIKQFVLLRRMIEEFHFEYSENSHNKERKNYIQAYLRSLDRHLKEGSVHLAKVIPITLTRLWINYINICAISLYE